MLPPRCERDSILRRWFARQLFEDTIELRQWLKTDGECDLTDAQVRAAQEIASLFESGSCDVIDKVYAGDLLESFAQMICADADWLRYFRERKFFNAMVLDKLSRFPNLYRFGPMAIARWLGKSICDYCYHRTLSSHSRRH